MREDAAWTEVEKCVETKQPKRYDHAVAVLRDLHALADRDDDRSTFQARLEALRIRDARKPSFLERLAQAKLP